MCICLSRELAKYDYFEFNLPLYYFSPHHTLFLLKQYCVSARGRGLKGLSFGGFGLKKKKNSQMEAKIKRICGLKKCMPRITD